MSITLYHEVSSDSVDGILQNGIKRDKGGEKRDAQIEKIDTFLDTHLPDNFESLGLNRRSVIYAYLEHEGNIVDITDGELVPLEKYESEKGTVLLRITVDPENCYVSDLDLYDTLKRAMQLDEQDSTREHLADQYWKRIVPLEEFQLGSIKRPEVMINADIEPKSIEIIK